MNSFLEKMVVVEMAYYYPGPYCCKILSELGARVLKIEPPSGDPMRYQKSIFAGINAGKELINLNLKEGEDRNTLYKIVENADVFVEGFRPGVAERLGVDYPALKNINEGLIYCSITGFGQNSGITRPVHDINVLSMAGICEISGLLHKHPCDPNVQLSDFASSVMAAVSILAAYIRKIKTGKGAYIDISMYDSAIFSIPLHILKAANESKFMPDFHLNPGYRIYRARDCYVSIGILDEPVFWERLCDMLGLEIYRNISFEERIKMAEEIENKIAEKLSGMNRDQIVKLFNEDIPYGILTNIDEVAENSGVIREVEFQGRTVKTVSFPATFLLG